MHFSPVLTQTINIIAAKITSFTVYMYVGMSVCPWENHTKKTYAKMRGRNYVAQTRTRACPKSDLGS